MTARATTWRELAITLVAGLGLSALLVTLWRGPDPAPGPPVVPTAAPAALLAPPVTAAPVSRTAVPLTATAPAPGAADYRLRGIIARPGAAAGAIIEGGDGRQHLVRVGSALAPGLHVTAISATLVTLTGADGDRTLDFGDRSPPAAAADNPIAANATLAGLAASVSDYRTGLQPRRIGGLIHGFRIVDTSRLPMFRKAGLRTGDIVLTINGNGIDSEEKIMELPAEVNGAKAVDITYERGGKRQSSHVAIER